MARIREKTLQFPGLDNVYTFADEADLFDANVACAVGEYRIYNGDLYCCTTAHTGAWDASHFKAVKMGKEVSELKTATASMNGNTFIDITRFDGTVALQNGTAEYYNGKLKLYGTISSNRYYLCLNGQNLVRTQSQTDFYQTLPKGRYKVSITASGNFPSGYEPQVVYTYTAFTSGNRLFAVNGETIIAENPIMLGFYAKSANYGTSDNPTYVDISISYYEEKASIKVVDNILAKNTQREIALISSDFENGGIGEFGSNLDRPKRLRTKGYIDCSKYRRIIFSAADGYKITITFYSDNEGSYVGRVDYIEGSGAFPIPANASYLRLQYESTDPDVTLSTSDYSNIRIYLDYAINTLANQIGSQTKCLAIGDSITVGKCSDTNAARAGYGWFKILAESLGYSYYNSGVNGMGYVTAGDNGIHLSDQLTTLEALTEDFNLITIMLGINDYNSSSVTISDITDSLSSAIERLMAKFPNARLVVFTPLNACNRGTASDCYDYGYTYNGRSLKDIADGIIETCDSYGVESHMISNGFVFNSQNIVGLIPDEVHPSQLGHMLVAKAIARYLIN